MHVLPNYRIGHQCTYCTFLLTRVIYTLLFICVITCSLVDRFFRSFVGSLDDAAIVSALASGRVNDQLLDGILRET